MSFGSFGSNKFDQQSDEQSEQHSDEDQIEEEKIDEWVEEEEQSPKTEECFCDLFGGGYVKPTLEQYQQDKLKESPLFKEVLTLDDNEQLCIEKPSDDSSILVTGFGIRRLSSLQNALLTEERKRLLEIYKSQKPGDKEQDEFVSPSESVTFPSPKKISQSSKRTVDTETESTIATSDIAVQQDKVRYLMGLQEDEWEEEEETYPNQEDLLRKMFSKVTEDKFIFAETVTMRSAQIYLRTHRIFDFFQFIIAHLLSASPENPITFILVLLNKILLYRSGTGHPPLLYDHRHIEQLFRLMDRMNSGFIDPKQYESGMNTLGICQYNKEPSLSDDGLVSMDVFVREALESETALFNDLIKRKWTGNKPTIQPIFSDMGSPTRSFISGTHLMPSDLVLRDGKHFPSTNALEDQAEG